MKIILISNTSKKNKFTSQSNLRVSKLSKIDDKQKNNQSDHAEIKNGINSYVPWSDSIYSTVT